MTHVKSLKLTDEEIVVGLLRNDEATIRHLLFERCASMFAYIIRSIFDHKADKDELVNEFYLYLQENDWYKLRQFDYRSKLTTWLSVVATRFFQRKRDELIENDSNSALYMEKEKVHDEQTQTIQRIDVETLLNRLPNERYRYVIHSLIIKDMEPQHMANEMGITVDNLYNIKRRAMQQLAAIVRKEGGYGR